jgi:hypothetical protein
MLSLDTKHAMDARPRTPELPPIDERLVAPGSRYEIYDGELAYVSPADPPHGTRHAKLSALVEAHAAADFEVGCDLLTRTSETSDVAPDVSIYPDADDPVTGGRQLEHLAFEVVSKQRLSRASRKAAKLVERGVRRVFAIDVEHERALEWSASRQDWIELDPGGEIVDPALAAPLPIAAMLSSATADDAMARALIVKRNPEIEAVRAEERTEGKQQGLAEGVLRGKAEALLVLLASRGVAIPRADRDRILGEMDPERLDRWIARATRCTDIAELFAPE